MIRAVAWDVDGTLVDSEPTHHRALMQVSARHGVAVAADDSRFIGVAMEDVWSVLGPAYPPDLSRDAWLAAIIDAYIERSAELVALAGAPPAVLALHAAGVRQCCVSNSARRVVEANLAAIGLAPIIEFVVAREDVADGKPDPAPYALACRRLGLPPAQVLAVEDSPVGVASARAAALPVLQLGRDFDDFSTVVAAVLGTGERG